MSSGVVNILPHYGLAGIGLAGLLVLYFTIIRPVLALASDKLVSAVEVSAAAVRESNRALQAVAMSNERVAESVQAVAEATRLLAGVVSEREGGR